MNALVLLADFAVEQFRGEQSLALGNIERGIRVPQRLSHVRRIAVENTCSGGSADGYQRIRQTHGLAQLHQCAVAGRQQVGQFFKAGTATDKHAKLVAAKPADNRTRRRRAL